MNQPDVSVIVTVYNKAEYLRQCIESILNQTKENLQLVIVNDGSTDESLEIINSFADRSETIIVVNQENMGLAEARISGFRAATGRYIGWVDADDFVKPEMYQKLFDLAEAEGADLVYCDYEFYPHKVSSKAKWFREYYGVRDWHFIDKNTAFWSKLMTRELLLRVDIIELLKKYGEYSPIVPMLEADKISYTKEQLYVYRVGHDTMSGGSFEGKVDHYLKGVRTSRTLYTMIEGKSYESELREYFSYRYIYTLLLLATVSARNNDKANFAYARSELNRMKYRKNRYLNVIVKENYGGLKSFVMTKIIPQNYYLSRLIAKAAL